MKKDEEDEAVRGWLREVVEVLREPVERRPGAIDAVLAAAAREETPEARRGRGTEGRRGALQGVWGWVTGTRVALSPLSATAWAAAIAALTFLASVSSGPGAGVAPEPAVERHQFVLVAPEAESVSLVGDFNRWDVSATPLVRRGEVWTVELPLEAGRHVYSFVVDGVEWVPDASAARAPEDEFGRPSSVLVVHGRGT